MGNTFNCAVLHGEAYHCAAASEPTNLEGVSGGSIHRDVELRDGDQVPDPVWELGISNQERGNAAFVQL